MQTNPEQWAVDFAHELWPMAQVGPSEGIEDAALRIAEAIQAAFAEREARLVVALERIATVDMGGGFLGAQACRKVASDALKDRTHG